MLLHPGPGHSSPPRAAIVDSALAFRQQARRTQNCWRATGVQMHWTFDVAIQPPTEENPEVAHLVASAGALAIVERATWRGGATPATTPSSGVAVAIRGVE